MAKIPVGATIAHAYRFAFGDFIKILGVVWLPWLLMVGGSILVMTKVLAMSEAIADKNVAAIGPVLVFLLPLYLLMFVIICMQTIGITQLALGRREGPAWIYFSLGRPVWRLIGSILLLIVALVLGYFILLLVSFVLGIGAGMIGKAIPSPTTAIVIGLVTALAVLALWCGYFYSLVRLTFLLTPVIAAREEGFALERAWTLGKGNFWRMFAVILAVTIPFIILEGVFLFGFVWHGWPPMPPLHATQEQLAAFNAASLERNAAMMRQMNANWYIVYPLGGLVTVLFYGLGAGAQAFAYRAVTEAPMPDSPAPSHP